MAKRFRGETSAADIDMNHNTMNKREFGRDQDSIPNDLAEWQGEPFEPANPRLNYPLPFQSNVNQHLWNAGEMLFCMREDGCPALRILDITQVQMLMWEAGVRQLEKVHGHLELSNREDTLKRGFKKEDELTFFNMDTIRDKLDFCGVLARQPTPYMRTGRAITEYAMYGGGPSLAPLAIFGHTFVPNLWDNYPAYLYQDMKLFLLIKMVPISEMGTTVVNSSGITIRSKMIAPKPTDMVMTVIPYVSADNMGPQRCKNMDIYTNSTMHPPTNSRSYKQFLPKDPTKPDILDPGNFTIEDGMVICVGTAAQGYSPKVSAADKLSRLQPLKRSDLTGKTPIEVHLVSSPRAVAPYL